MKNVINKKTSQLYYVKDENVLDVTENKNQRMILYQNAIGKLFVREYNEFWDKFEDVKKIDYSNRT